MQNEKIYVEFIVLSNREKLPKDISKNTQSIVDLLQKDSFSSKEILKLYKASVLLLKKNIEPVALKSLIKELAITSIKQLDIFDSESYYSIISSLLKISTYEGAVDLQNSNIKKLLCKAFQNIKDSNSIQAPENNDVQELINNNPNLVQENFSESSIVAAFEANYQKNKILPPQEKKMLLPELSSVVSSEYASKKDSPGKAASKKLASTVGVVNTLTAPDLTVAEIQKRIDNGKDKDNYNYNYNYNMVQGFKAVDITVDLIRVIKAPSYDNAVILASDVSYTLNLYLGPQSYVSLGASAITTMLTHNVVDGLFHLFKSASFMYLEKSYNLKGSYYKDNLIVNTIYSGLYTINNIYSLFNEDKANESNSNIDAVRNNDVNTYIDAVRNNDVNKVKTLFQEFVPMYPYKDESDLDMFLLKYKNSQLVSLKELAEIAKFCAKNNIVIEDGMVFREDLILASIKFAAENMDDNSFDLLKLAANSVIKFNDFLKMDKDFSLVDLKGRSSLLNFNEMILDTNLLGVAVAKNKIDYAKFLLEYGVNPNVLLNDLSYTNIALLHGNQDMFKLLLSYGAKIDSPDRPNFTLANFIKEGNLEITELLLKCKASTEISDGITVRDLLSREEVTEEINKLLDDFESGAVVYTEEDCPALINVTYAYSQNPDALDI
ncbi:MAG: hypothetical protein WBJ81_05605 [Rickettsiales bacterium]